MNPNHPMHGMTEDQRIDRLRQALSLMDEPEAQRNLETMPLCRDLLAYAQDLVDLHDAPPESVAALATYQEDQDE